MKSNIKKCKKEKRSQISVDGQSDSRRNHVKNKGNMSLRGK